MPSISHYVCHTSAVSSDSQAGTRFCRGGIGSNYRHGTGQQGQTNHENRGNNQLVILLLRSIDCHLLSFLSISYYAWDFQAI